MRYGYPFIDVNTGGSVQGMIAACDKVASVLPADVKVIPGHGDLANLGDVKEYAVMLKETSPTIQKAIDAGKTPDQMKKEKNLPSGTRSTARDSSPRTCSSKRSSTR